MKATFKLLAITFCLFSSFCVNAQNEKDSNHQRVKKFNLRSDVPGIVVRAKDVKNVLKSELKIDTEIEIIHDTSRKSKTDNLGFKHDRYIQKYKGIKIEFADIRVHHKNDSVKSMNGEYHNKINISTIPSISKEVAILKAKNFVNAKKYRWEDRNENIWLQKITKNQIATFYPNPELLISKNYLDLKDTNLHLAYKIDIYAIEPLSRAYIYVDAMNGSVINIDPIIKTLNANAATRYSGNRTISTQANNTTFRLRDYDNNRGSGIETYNLNRGTNYSTAVDFNDSDNNWTAAEYSNTNKDNGALDAHWGAMMTYDYFRNIHSRNSYDDNGAIIRSYVHYASNYDNAFWNGSVMTYGDGSGTNFDILTSLDVAGHEIGHAVCQYTAGLVYQNESGAINEGLSDIWGACIEQYATTGKQTWLIGEDIERRTGHVSLRSMSNPNAEGQPDTYGGTNWYSLVGCSPSAGNDYCGVHRNSGVMNFWFYLLTNGGSGINDINNNYNVNGIGILKAAQITYRAENIYMTSFNNYRDVRTHTIQSAIDLFGVLSPEVVSVTKAWYAVGVGNDYKCNGIQYVTNVNYINNSTIQVDCDLNLTNVNVSNNSKLTITANGEVLINPNFEVTLGSEIQIK
jgi:bacillolysin